MSNNGQNSNNSGSKIINVGGGVGGGRRDKDNKS